MMQSITYRIQDIDYIIQTYKDFCNDIKTDCVKFSEYQTCMTDLDSMAKVLLDVLVNKMMLNLVHKLQEGVKIAEEEESCEQLSCAMELSKILKELYPEESAQNKQYQRIINENDNDSFKFLLEMATTDLNKET